MTMRTKRSSLWIDGRQTHHLRQRLQNTREDLSYSISCYSAARPRFASIVPLGRACTHLRARFQSHHSLINNQNRNNHFVWMNHPSQSAHSSALEVQSKITIFFSSFFYLQSRRPSTITSTSNWVYRRTEWTNGRQSPCSYWIERICCPQRWDCIGASSVLIIFQRRHQIKRKKLERDEGDGEEILQQIKCNHISVCLISHATLAVSCINERHDQTVT